MPLESSITAASLAVFGATGEAAEAAEAAKCFVGSLGAIVGSLGCVGPRFMSRVLYVANSIFGDIIPLDIVRPYRAAS